MESQDASSAKWRQLAFGVPCRAMNPSTWSSHRRVLAAASPAILVPKRTRALALDAGGEQIRIV